MEMYLVILLVVLAAAYIVWRLTRPPVTPNWRAYQRVLEKQPAPRKRAKEQRR